MKKLFVCIGNENTNNPCYVNIFNIDYIIRENDRTTIRFRGSNNTITASISTKDLMKRIEVALNGSVPEEAINRFELIDMEE